MTPCDLANAVEHFGKFFAGGFASMLMLWAATTAIMAVLIVIRGR